MGSAFDFLVANYPWIAIVLIVAYIVYRVTKYFVMQHKELVILKDSTDKFVEQSNCVAHHKDITDTKGALNKISDIMMTMSTDLAFLKGILSTSKLNNPLTESHSPIGLSGAGVQAAERMGVNAIIDSSWSTISDLIQAHTSSLNAYDIQQYCIEASTVSLDKLFASSDVDRIKMFAYNEGQPLAYYGPMIGVLIRDKYFSENNIQLGEVDAYAPKIEGV